MEKWVYFDVDETLVFWDIDAKDFITVTDPWSNGDSFTRLTPNRRIINKLIEHSANGDTVIVWSQGGYDWAEAVCNKLDISKYIDFFLSKPHEYYDDLDCKSWMGERNFP